MYLSVQPSSSSFDTGRKRYRVPQAQDPISRRISPLCTAPGVHTDDKFAGHQNSLGDKFLREYGGRLVVAAAASGNVHSQHGVDEDERDWQTMSWVFEGVLLMMQTWSGG